MDPLSITASVLTLLSAANGVCTLLQSVRNADRGLQSLVKEVISLNGFLRSIEKALEECRGNPYALTHIDPDLWKESKIALSDCQKTLGELDSVLSGPKRPSRSNTLFRRARVAAELHSRAGEIASFREKISMSNLSLQTLLQVINVSLSLRSNESHETIMKELKELKEALKKSAQAATVSYSALFLNEQDIRLVHHLKGLIRAADDFHASASTTASTVVGRSDSQTAPSTEFGEDDVRSGIRSRIPSMKRKQIETYLLQSQQIVRPGSSASNNKKDEAMTPVILESPKTTFKAREIDSDFTFSTICTSGFSKIAQRALQQLDLPQAEGRLKEALKWHQSSGSDDAHINRHLQTQLALCNLLQGNRQGAQDLILDLVESITEDDTVTHQLLYALSLLQLHELDFEGARNNSKRLWKALQRTHCKVLGAKDAMRLLATSYRESGDSLLAEAIEAEVPDLRLFEPVPRMVDFLVECDELLARFFQPQGSPEYMSSDSVIHKIYDLPIAKAPSSLQIRQLVEDASLVITVESSSGTEEGLIEEASPIFIKDRPKKRSWSNLRDFLKPLLSRETSTFDLLASYTEPHNSASDTVARHGEQRQSPSKLRKRAKISQSAEMSSPRVVPNSGDPDAQKPVDSKQAPSTAESTKNMHQHDDSERVAPIEEWIKADEDQNQLQRRFSFQHGVPDSIRSTPSRHEMPNNEVFELMDTSLPVQEPCIENSMEMITSFDMELEIYNLLRDTLSSNGARRASSGHSSTINSPFSDLEVTDAYNSSASDWDSTSDLDQSKQSTRRTSVDSQLGDVSGDIPDQGVVPTKCQQSTVLGNNSGPPMRTFPFKVTIDYWHTRERRDGDSPMPLRLGASNFEAATDTVRPRSLKLRRGKTRRDFAEALANYRHNGPCLKSGIFRRPPFNAATKRRGLFGAKNHKHDFDFGFNSALYSGPKAVSGPYTDPGEMEPSKKRDACVFAPDGNPTEHPVPSKLNLRRINNTQQESVNGKGESFANTDETPLNINEEVKTCPTTLEEFLGVSREHDLSLASSSSKKGDLGFST